MKYLFLSLLIIGGLSNADGQAIEFKCFIKCDCTDTIKLYKDYLLTKDKHYYYPNENFICSLPDAGTYYFTPTSEAKEVFPITPLTVTVNSLTAEADTFETSDLYEIIILESPDPDANKYEHWEYCGKPANGYIVDHTMNGHTEGFFKKGRAIKALKTYNEKGELTFIARYNRQGKLTRTERLSPFYKH